MELHPVSTVLEELHSSMGELREAFDIDSLKEDAKILLKKASSPDFWTSQEAQKVTQRLSRLQNLLDRWQKMEHELEELTILAELLEETNDQELQAEFYDRALRLRKEIDSMEMELLLDEEYDESNAILTVHAGAGGLDAQDWAEILSRMYLRWAERHGYETEIIDILPDDEAGIKYVTILIKGFCSYGYLKAEKGIHRLVRISPFDSSKRRHTSFASVEVIPELPEDVDVEIRPEEIKMETFRASGAGGQHVNMTDSAVRLTHIPTGIAVTCQNERSQHMNRQTALRFLKAKLYEKYQQEKQKKIEDLHGEKKEIGWGSQIRSYVLHPYTMVKDHRTGYTSYNVDSVLDGDIDDFIITYLRMRKNTIKAKGA
ncbi:peptide chain release factor 2 [Acetomicrobium sp.]|uniref:peptide chain release factor 2 n=1 Tax=Acetomicrobium sp. TaxID=1872099 RepID=UPI002FCC84FC